MLLDYTIPPRLLHLHETVLGIEALADESERGYDLDKATRGILRVDVGSAARPHSSAGGGRYLRAVGQHRLAPLLAVVA